MSRSFPQGDVQNFWRDATAISGGTHQIAAMLTLALVLMNGFREISDALEEVASSNKAVAGAIENLSIYNMDDKGK